MGTHRKEGRGFGQGSQQHRVQGVPKEEEADMQSPEWLWWCHCWDRPIMAG